MKQINIIKLHDRIKAYKNDPKSLILFLLVCLCAAITMIALTFVIIYILVKGVPFLTTDLFKWEYNSENVSMLPALINTLLMAVLSLLFAVPIGIFSAVYLNEYAKICKKRQ